MRVVFLLLIFGFALSSCGPGYHSMAPPRPEKEYTGPDFSDKEEEKARQMYEDAKSPLLQNTSSKHQKDEMKRVFERLRENGKSVCAEVNVFHDGCKWLLLDLKNVDIPNLYPWGNRTININVGMLAYIENEDEFAFLLSHQMGHLLARHIEEKDSVSYAPTTGLWALGCTNCTKLNAQGVAVVPHLSQYNEDAPIKFNIAEEMESDYIAVYLMIAAGYDPVKGSIVLAKIDKFMEKANTIEKPKATYSDIHKFDIDRISTILAAKKEAEAASKPILPKGN